MTRPVVHLTTDTIPNLRFNLPFIEQDRCWVFEELLWSHRNRSACTGIFVESKDGLSDTRSRSRLPTGFGALNQDCTN